MLNRPIRIEYIPSKDYIVVADSQGIIHYLNSELEIIKSSSAALVNNKIYSLTVDEKYVYTRDYVGNVSKYSIDNLKRIKTVHTKNYFLSEGLLEGEEPSPSNARGLRVHKDYLYATNGFGQILKLNKESLNVEAIINHPSGEKTFIDYYNTENEEIHVISDKEGYLLFGNLEELEFNKKLKVDEGSVHVVRYDKRHDRYIATQDFGLDNSYGIESGIAVIDQNTLEIESYPITTDDAEFIFFNEDYTEVYTGGFDGNIYVFDNTEKRLKVKRILGPFHHQVSYALPFKEDKILVLMQSGELVISNKFGKILHELDYEYVCYWDFVNDKDEKRFYSPDGSGISTFEIEETPNYDILINKVDEWKYDFGLIFRLIKLEDGSFLVLSRQNLASYLDKTGNVVWKTNLEYLPKSISCNEQKSTVLIGLDNGVLQILDLKTGSIIGREDFGSSIYVCGYNGEDVVLGTSKGDLHILDENTLSSNHPTLSLGGYPKRIRIENSKIVLTGGEFGYMEIDTNSYTIVKQILGDVIYNTREETVRINDLLFMSTYGYQIGVYNYEDGEMVGLLEGEIPDYVKAMKHYKTNNGEDYLIIGGNTGFVQTYKLTHGLELNLLREYKF